MGAGAGALEWRTAASLETPYLPLMQVFYVLRRTATRVRRALGGDLRYRIYLLGSILLALFCLHVLAMLLFEGLSLGDAAWLTITTATTVGYGDMSATTTAGRWATVLLMYVGGIFVLAQLAGLVFEGAQNKLEQQRLGKVPIRARGHIIIFGYREAYVRRVVQEIRASLSPLHREEIVIISPSLELLPDGLPQQNVLHVNGPLYDERTLEMAGLSRAARVAILPETDADQIDYANLDLVHRLREIGYTNPIIYAARTRAAQRMAEDAGADDSVLLDNNYPDIFSRAILTVGAEDVIDDIIDRGGIELLVVHQALDCTVAQVLHGTRGRALLLAVHDQNGDYQLHPHLDRRITDERLIFLMNMDDYTDQNNARAALNQALEAHATGREIQTFTTPKTVGLLGSQQRASDSFFRALQKELPDVSITYLGPLGQITTGKTDERYTKPDAIILLSDQPNRPESDARTYLSINALRNEHAFRGRIVAEAVLPASSDRFQAAGATDVIRPVLHNVDILARSVITGAEEIVDNLYGSEGSHELLSFAVPGPISVGRLQEQCYGIGLLLAVRSNNDLVVAPIPELKLEGGVAYLLIRRQGGQGFRSVAKHVASLRE